MLEIICHPDQVNIYVYENQITIQIFAQFLNFLNNKQNILI